MTKKDYAFEWIKWMMEKYDITYSELGIYLERTRNKLREK